MYLLEIHNTVNFLIAYPNLCSLLCRKGRNVSLTNTNQNLCISQTIALTASNLHFRYILPFTKCRNTEFDRVTRFALEFSIEEQTS